MADHLLFILAIALADEEELEDDDDIELFGMVSTFMRKNLNRSRNFFEVAVPMYFADEFQGHFRLSRTTAEKLAREVVATGQVGNGNNFGRIAIPAEKQVLVYLWMMANGRETTRQVADRFDITMSSCGRVLRRVMSALLSLQQQYIKWPNVTEMRDIVQHFEEGGMPGVIGVIDGTFIRIRAPSMNPEAYNCRKKFHALQLQMVCDNNMVLTDVLAGWPGSVHDSRVLRNSSLCATAADKFPHDYHLLGDGGYPLKRWLMVPFCNNGHLPLNQVNFNRVLSSNRQIVERAVSFVEGEVEKATIS